MNPQIQEQIPSGRSIPVKMIKGAGLDGLPEPLPDAAAPPGSSSAWMSYAQHPSYVPSWLPIPDSMPMANTMPNGSNAQMFSTPFFFPSGSAVEYGFPPGTAPLGPLHAFQQPHNGQAIPQSGARLPSFTGYIPSTSRSGPSTEQVNPALSQSIQSGTGSRPDVEGLVPTQSGSQMPMEMNFCQPFSGQVRDVTLWPGSESDDYMTMMNELPGIIC
ncbi:uncharacterized protein BDW70DRAFT_24484 [Aspergillus foveolatus]|uniref:uncharacterized protein n=1 Tax=Aspergillus foveolatus TaxID=210207 RepID=UPI003CCE23EB